MSLSFFWAISSSARLTGFVLRLWPPPGLPAVGARRAALRGAAAPGALRRGAAGAHGHHGGQRRAAGRRPPAGRADFGPGVFMGSKLFLSGGCPWV